MNTIDDIKIIGLDPSRPPRMRKESYIDLYFQLAMKAPEDWCEDFNALGRKLSPSVKVDPKVGLFIDAYVNNMDQIVSQLAAIKETVTECNEQYHEKILAKKLALAASNAVMMGQDGEQQKLNVIIETLVFDD